jgi:hypothetical protein
MEPIITYVEVRLLQYYPLVFTYLVPCLYVICTIMLTYDMNDNIGLDLILWL